MVILRPLVVLGLFCLSLVTYQIFLVHVGGCSVSSGSDEVVYVRVAQTLVRTGEVFPMWHGGVPFYEKPPLKFIFSALILKVFGESNFSFRILDATLGVCAVLLSTLLAFRLSGSICIAIAVGLLLLGVPEWVISPHSFRRAVLDGFLTVLVILSALLSWELRERLLNGKIPWTQSTLFGLVCACAVMTKSVGGLVPVGMLLLLVISEVRRIPPASLVSLTPAVVIGPACLVLYCIGLWIYTPKALNTFIGVEILQRVSQGFTGHNSNDPFFYLRYVFLRGGIVPPVLLVLGTVGTMFEVKRSHSLRFCALWGLVPILLFSCASAKVPWYLNPYAPFLACMTVMGTISLLSRITWSNRSVVLLVPCLVFALLPYARALGRHIAFVAGDTRRIQLDIVAEEILKTPGARVVLFDDCISGRANPIKGKFNVEGIYREMLRDRLTLVDAIPTQAPPVDTYVFSSAETHERLPSGWKEVKRLLPILPRREEVVVTRY
jgi:4-amino-4-deoxy-L-arabinose transferase-like glycosyltransferase